MQRQLIELKHHLDDYECMWNGIEDLYIRDTGEKLPPNFFFVLSGFGSFCYLKTPQADLKRLIALGDGRTKKMYEFLAPIVGFNYKHHEYKTFTQALRQAKKEIDNGYPAVLGALDMYYLPYYPKLYHGDHIPFHYVLMVGYDDAEQCIYLLDCGRTERQKLTYTDLKFAWDCHYPGLSNPNTVCTIRMQTKKDKYQIAKEAFVKKSALFLNPPVRFLGISGLKKFIAELPDLKKQLTAEEYRQLLLNMVMFFGTVPALPNILSGNNEPDEIKYGGGFDKMSVVLDVMGQEYENPYWLQAATGYRAGADIIAEITNIITAYLTETSDNTDQLPVMFTKIKDIMTEGFKLLTI